MDKKIIDRLEDIRNRMIQAHKIFSTAAYELSVTIESLDDDFKDDLESYAKDADSFEPDRDDTIDSIITEIETTIDYISDLQKVQNGICRNKVENRYHLMSSKHWL